LVRWRCASALRPSPSRLPQGADNKAQEAKKGEKKRAEGYPACFRLKLVERHGHAAAVARHEDGDGTAILSIEEAHAAWRLRLRPPRLRRFAKDNRLREIVNAPSGADGPGNASYLHLSSAGLRTVANKRPATLSPWPAAAPSGKLICPGVSCSSAAGGLACPGGPANA